MSFFERAKAAATDLAAKADVAMQQAGINTPGSPVGGGAPGVVVVPPGVAEVAATAPCATSACWPTSRPRAARHPPGP